MKINVAILPSKLKSVSASKKPTPKAVQKAKHLLEEAKKVETKEAISETKAFVKKMTSFLDDCIKTYDSAEKQANKLVKDNHKEMVPKLKAAIKDIHAFQKKYPNASTDLDSTLIELEDYKAGGNQKSLK